MRRNHNFSKGVTLIELIMAAVILALVAIPMASMIGSQIQGMMTSTDFTASGNLARQAMERLHNIPYGSLANGSSVDGSYTVTWTVATVVGGGGAERKDITLTAKRTGSATDIVTLYGSITKDVTHGL
ncbi:MAG TPA: prepilin-type N-terminal cleavage/methylation domain-containing protein [Candidatus Omnitrophota bacterium]|nr:prepilin-type N-terminal cleavage/methylation domain-containing protein [Candidatus Omnitrophota bacterium]